MSCSKTAEVPPHRHVLDLARATRVCSKDDIVRVDQLCEAIKAFLRGRCEAFISARQSEPIAEIYSSDATPLVCISRYASHYGDHVVQRRGRNSAEWLIEKVFVAGRPWGQSGSDLRASSSRRQDGLGTLPSPTGVLASRQRKGPHRHHHLTSHVGPGCEGPLRATPETETCSTRFGPPIAHVGGRGHLD